MVLISRNEIESMIYELKRATGVCIHARQPSKRPSLDELLHAEPTEFYSGASGLALAKMQLTIRTPESHL